jgi:16S rRNA C967 or C1407 C5-methylase (RsmB/RsmF family)
MATFQRQMLDSLTRNVKPNGTLTYSTCSITVEENEMIIERFLKQHPEFTLIDVEPRIGLPGLRGLDKCQRLYSHIHDCNGFFIAKMQKE